VKKNTRMNSERLDALSDATRHIVIQILALNIERSSEEGMSIVDFLHLVPGNPILLNPQFLCNGLCLGGPTTNNA